MANRSAICGVGLPLGVEAPSFARCAAESRLRQRKTSAVALRASPCRRTRKRLQRADTEGHGKTHGPFKNHLNGKLGLLVNYDTCPKTVVEQRANRGNHPFRVPRRRPFVSGMRVRPEGPKEQGDALRACSNMRGDRFFRVGASRLARMPASVVARSASMWHRNHATPAWILRISLDRQVCRQRTIALRASARSANSPPAIICTIRLPIAVPSVGPANTSSPVASAVSAFR